jgi:hypothetical protein
MQTLRVALVLALLAAALAGQQACSEDDIPTITTLDALVWDQGNWNETNWQ